MYLVMNWDTGEETLFDSIEAAREFMGQHYKASHYMDLVTMPISGSDL